MSDQPAKPKRPKFPHLHIPDDVDVEYVNLTRVSHSPSDIVLDMAHLLPGSKSALVTSRIVMTPIAAKLFARALVENIKRYETTYGEIKIPANTTLADYLFRPPTPPEEPPER